MSAAERVSNGICVKCRNLVREGLMIRDGGERVELCGFCIGEFLKHLIESKQISKEEFIKWIK